MSKKRQQYSASFKSKVALAALKGDQTTSEIAARFQIHPTWSALGNERCWRMPQTSSKARKSRANSPASPVLTNCTARLAD